MMGTKEKAGPNQKGDENKLGVLSAISYIVCNIVGTGIFINPTGILQHSGSIGLSLVIWAVCGLISLCGALCFIELGTSIRSSGADFAYQTYAGWDAIAFSMIFAQTILYFPSSQAVLVTTISAYIVEVIEIYICPAGWGDFYFKKIFGLLVLYLLTYLNFYSIEKYAAKVQVFALVFKIGSLILISGVGIYYLAAGKGTAVFDDSFSGTTLTVGGIVKALYGGFWAYVGWDTLNYGLEDIKNPKTSLPIAALGGLVIIGTLYLLTNIAYFAVLGKNGVLVSDAVAVTFISKLAGTEYAAIVPAAVGFMAATSLNVGVFTSSRVVFSGSRGGHLPSFLSGLQPTSDSPRPAILFMTIMATIFSLIGNLDVLLGYVNFVMWLSHGVSVIAMVWIKFRKIPVDPGAIKMPYVVHFIFILSAAYLVLVPMYENPILAGVGSAVIVFGLIVYFVAIRRSLPDFFINLDFKIRRMVEKLFLVIANREPTQSKKAQESLNGAIDSKFEHVTRF